MKNRFCLITLLITLCFNIDKTFAQNGLSQPPVAKKITTTTSLHGETLVDDYFWLREKTNPEVIAYLEAENAYTDAVMKSTAALQETLYQEMLDRIKETDLTVPYRMGNYFYYSREEKGKQYRIYCRKAGSLESPEQVILDLNKLAEGQKFIRLGAFSVSPDGNLLAYSIDHTGFRNSFLHFKDLRTGKLLADSLGKVNEFGVIWANDNHTLFYTTEDSAKRPFRFYRHVLGQARAQDVLLYEETDERFGVFPNASRSRTYLFINSNSLTTTEVRFLPLERPSETPRLVQPREANHEYYVDHHGERFFIRTNDQGRNFRLVAAPVSDPEKKNWQEIIPHRANVMLESMDFFTNHSVRYEREDGLLKGRVTDLRTNETHDLAFPEPVYSAFYEADFNFDRANPEFDTSVLRFSYQSFTTPLSVFDYDMATRRRKLLKQTEVLGGYEATQYQSERIYAKAADGTRIPISLVYKNGLQRDGMRPLLLWGYGSYGLPEIADFSSNRVSLLDRGVIYAIAHIRGGGEMGKAWHDQGRMMMKRNTFTDFIAAAEHLIAEKYTSKERLAIEGASAGGLLMGAVTNMRPDLFKAVVALVPFVDVLNTMLDASLPLTVSDYEEWGNPNIKAEYDYIKTYSPYDNIERKNYPAILVKTSLNDSQVMYWEPAKYVAKLRAMKTDRNVLLLNANLSPAGHGGPSGRYKRLREEAFEYAFILGQLSVMK